MIIQQAPSSNNILSASRGWLPLQDRPIGLQCIHCQRSIKQRTTMKLHQLITPQPYSVPPSHPRIRPPQPKGLDSQLRICLRRIPKRSDRSRPRVTRNIPRWTRRRRRHASSSHFIQTLKLELGEQGVMRAPDEKEKVPQERSVHADIEDFKISDARRGPGEEG